jgi:hypothetical protein
MRMKIHNTRTKTKKKRILRMETNRNPSRRRQKLARLKNQTKRTSLSQSLYCPLGGLEPL